MSPRKAFKRTCDINFEHKHWSSFGVCWLPHRVHAIERFRLNNYEMLFFIVRFLGCSSVFSKQVSKVTAEYSQIQSSIFKYRNHFEKIGFCCISENFSWSHFIFPQYKMHEAIGVAANPAWTCPANALWVELSAHVYRISSSRTAETKPFLDLRCTDVFSCTKVQR